MAGRSLPISLRRKIRKRSRRSKNIRLSFLRFLRQALFRACPAPSLNFVSIEPDYRTCRLSYCAVSVVIRMMTIVTKSVIWLSQARQTGPATVSLAPKTGPQAKVYVRRFTSESPAPKVDTGRGTPRRSTTGPDFDRMKGTERGKASYLAKGGRCVRRKDSETCVMQTNRKYISALSFPSCGPKIGAHHRLPATGPPGNSVQGLTS